MTKLLDFTKVVKDCTGGNAKIKQSTYLSEGVLPVVDQGQKLIAGYVDDEAVKYNGSLPCVIFGDHTCALKYVDFDFALGADGTKILVPDHEYIDAKYLFYFLNTVHIPDRGYSRHFKYLKRCKIPIVPLSKQRELTKILDTADRLRQKRKEQIALLDDYLKSVFLEMFGDPQVNPKTFPIRELRSFYCDEKNGTKCGPFGSALKKHEYTNQGMPVWNMDNISLQGQMIPSVNLCISKEKYDQLKAYSVQNGDVIISRAGTVGKMCVLRSSFDKSIISTNLIRVRFNQKLIPEYFVALMTYCKGRVGRLKTGPDGSFTHMNTGILDTLKFPYPSVELQKKFVEIKEHVEQVKQKMRVSLDEMDDHFNALMQRYFGER